MFCYKCGKQMVDSALFCPNCGTMVKEDKGAQLAAVADRLKNGDSTAFNDLYAQTQKYVRYVVRQAGLSEHDADDVVQEIYVTIYQKIGDLSDTKSCLGMVKMIAHHAAIDFIRKNSKEQLYRKKMMSMFLTMWKRQILWHCLKMPWIIKRPSACWEICWMNFRPCRNWQ